MPNLSLQDRIGGFVSMQRAEWSLPSEPAVLDALIDTLAVALAARNEPAVRQVLAYAGTSGETGVTPVWIEQRGLAPEMAALINGVAAHALDYDDVAPAWRGHASVVLLPALLALPNSSDLSGHDLVDSYAIGFEIGARLGRACAEAQYRAGWHTTATIGTIAATAACCRAMRLDAKTTSAALGLAVAHAAGPQANFGTSAKPLHAGFAAAAAVRSARLATHGIKTSPLALEGPAGFVDLYGGNGVSAAFAGLGEEPPAATSGALERKWLPICYAGARAIEAIRIVQAQHGISARDIELVEVSGSSGSHKPLLHRPPADGTEAKFSLEYAIALMLVDGGIGLRSFTPEAFARRHVHDVMRRIRLSEIDGPPAPRLSRVRVALSSGRVLEHTVAQIESQNLKARLDAKVADCLAFGGWADRGAALREVVLSLPSHRVSRLFEMLSELRGTW